ncbi:MAG: hypothetical protein EA392_09820 [Cryomorphaceae bacterium]|nr:MAG: hypothetical protein EA392_09820 [Cryomorphaceae bacterium]
MTTASFTILMDISRHAENLFFDLEGTALNQKDVDRLHSGIAKAFEIDTSQVISTYHYYERRLEYLTEQESLMRNALSAQGSDSTALNLEQKVELDQSMLDSIVEETADVH